MRIVVTGGAGFIGANFLNLMVPRFPQHHFINLDKLTYAANLASLAPVSGLPNYTLERVDIADSDAIQRVFDDHAPDTVIHFAAESHVDRSICDPGDFIRTNIDGTFKLLDACLRNWSTGAGLFHHVSTDEVFGSLGATGAFTETTRYDPSSPYSASKAASDHLVRAYHRTYGLRVKITNCSNNYGPLQFPEKLIPLMILNIIERKPLPIYGRGLNVRDWLYVEDHCEAIWTVVENGEVGETYNVGGRSEVRNIDVVDSLCRIIADETGAKVADLLALKTFVRDRPGHDMRYAIDESKIRRQLGWQPKESFDTGLRKTVRWYLKNGDWIEQVRSGAYRSWMESNYSHRGGV